MKTSTEDTGAASEEGKKEGEGNESDESQSLFSTLKGHLNTANNWLMKGLNITNGITNSKYLQPYKLLYWLKPTNKRFVFPMVA